MRPLIAANWKMHGDMDWTDKPSQFEELLPASKREGVEVLICPPFPLIAPLKDAADKASIHIGAQNCHAEVKGAHTGEVNAELLSSVGAKYIIVGHSERRAQGESHADVKAKAEAVHRAGLIPIICVGETLTQRKAARTHTIVKNMLLGSMPEDSENVVIAYEPVWAIGTGETASAAEIVEVHMLIRELIGPNIRILYGGSVKPTNAEEILSIPNVNGALIGGAGLEMTSLAEIARFAI